jgi:two-component system, OmpR family, phosphate regulon response regulator PhoB
VDKRKILVIEDDKDIAEVLETVLAFNSFDVVGMERTDDIIEAVSTHKPDLVLTDYLLYGMNGGKICKAIKSNPKTCHIPVVLISAYHELAIAMGSFGFDAFIPKPFQIGKLVNTINNLLGQQNYDQPASN